MSTYEKMLFQCTASYGLRSFPMVRPGPWKQVPNRSAWKGRHRDAENFLQAAQDALALADPGDSGKPIMSAAVRALIAYGDALTIKFGGIKNTTDHSMLPRAMKQALGRRAKKQQMERLHRLLGQKNDIDYHHRDIQLAEARKFLKRTRRFARWAEKELAR